MKNKNLFLITIIILFISISCTEEYNDISSSFENKYNEKIINNEKTKKAISFLNTHFISQYNLTYRIKGGKILNKYSEKKIEKAHNLNDENGNPFLKLICFKPSGYVLISNLKDTPNPPVLFYSQEKFDENNVNYALIEYIQEFFIMHAKMERPPDSDEDKDGDGSWDDGTDTGESGDSRDSPYYRKETVVDDWIIKTQKGPLLSTYWNQRYPYNKVIEKIQGKGTLVGCVAIAIGQIMNYNRKNNLKNYNWDKINVNNPTTDDLPNFLYDVANGVHMDYGTAQSGGSSSNLKKSLTYFSEAGYNQKSYDYDYTIFKNFIDNNKPVYLSGFAERKSISFIIRWGWKHNKGHAWVGDGYKIIKRMVKVKIDNGNKGGGISYNNKISSTIKYTHMNWGWGNYYQSGKQGGGWCTYNYFKSPSLDFKYKKKMIGY